MKWAEYLFFFFFFFLIFVSVFETTEICLGVYQNGHFYRKKQKQNKTFHAGKKSGNVTLPPLKNIPLTSLYIDIYCGGKFSNLPPCTPGYAPTHTVCAKLHRSVLSRYHETKAYPQHSRMYLQIAIHMVCEGSDLWIVKRGRKHRKNPYYWQSFKIVM